jgi:hypothetical protein
MSKDIQFAALKFAGSRWKSPVQNSNYKHFRPVTSNRSAKYATIDPDR